MTGVLIIAAYFAGLCVGAYLSGYVCEHFPRRKYKNWLEFDDYDWMDDETF